MFPRSPSPIFSALIAGVVAASMLIGCSDRLSESADAADPPRDRVDTQIDTAPTDSRDGAGGPDARDIRDTTDAALPDTGADGSDGADGSGRDTAPDTRSDTRETGTDTTDTSATCGDGAAEGDEACDDGDTESGDYCSSDCSTVTGRCGDGKRQDYETCDDGEITSGCDTHHDGGDGTCVPPGECADGYTMQDGNCVEKQREEHVHIYISNTCKLSVSPQGVSVPRGQTISFTYHNHSTDYAADVWLSYKGGYLDLKQGNKWDDQFVHCQNGSRPYEAYADISINGFNLRDSSCPGHRMKIECQ